MPVARANLLAAMLASSGHCLGAESVPDDVIASAQQRRIPNIIVVGKREHRDAIASAATTLENDDLYKSHVLTTNEALRKVAGVVVRDEEGFGMRPNIGIRGMNPTRSTKTLLLEDGIPLAYAPYGDNASYYHPPIDRFARVEVLKGAGQIGFGPQTIAGAINYVTPDPPETPEGYVSLEGGNRDYWNGQFHYGGWYRQLGGMVDVVHKQGDGARDNTELEINDVTLKGIYEITPTMGFIARFNHFREDSEVGYSGITDAERQNFGLRYFPFDNDDFTTRRWGLSFTHSWDMTENIELGTSLYWSSFSRDWWRQSSRTTDTQCGTAFRNNRLDGVRVNPDACNSIQGRLRDYYAWGIEPRVKIRHGLFGLDNELTLSLRAHYEDQFRRQQNGTTPLARSGTLAERNARETDALAFYAAHRFGFGRLDIIPAVRVESIDFERRNLIAGGGCTVPPCEGTTDLTEVIPAISARYELSERLTLFTGVHEGFAPPRVEDLITNAGGSLETGVEQSLNFEAGVRSRPLERLELEFTYFRNDFDNQLAVGSIAGGDQPLAEGETFYEGTELYGRFDLPIGSGGHTLYLQSAWTWTWSADMESAFNRVDNGQPLQGDTAGNRLPYAPEHSLTATIGYLGPSGFDIRLETVHVGSQYADFLNLRRPADHPDGPASVSARSGQFGRIAAHTLVNLTATYVFAGSGFDLYAGIKNLFDDDHIVDRTRGILPGSPRQLQAGLRYVF